MRYLVALSFLLCSVLADATSISKIVVFGDSLSDNGNLFNLKQEPQNPPYFEGRFSNGTVWVEDLVKFYFPHHPEYHLLDYAFGGASVLQPEESIFSLTGQVQAYLLSHQNNKHINKERLFIVWIGANDYLQMPESLDETVVKVNRKISQSLQALAKAGARHFLLLNLPNLAHTPLAQQFQLTDELDYLSKRHNEAFANEIEHLKIQYPKVQWILYDVDTTFTQLFASPERYGFTNIKDTCYASFLEDMTLKTRSTNNACNGYFFFDPVHPTAATHVLLAKEAREILMKADIEF